MPALSTKKTSLLKPFLKEVCNSDNSHRFPRASPGYSVCDRIKIQESNLNSLENYEKSITIIFVNEIMSLRLLFFVFYAPVGIAAGGECQTWFQNTGLKKDKDCLIECVSARTDMGTFHCSEQCARLCKISTKERTVFNLSHFYPGLTKAERALSSKHSKKMLLAYKLTQKSEKLCSTLFKVSDTNDASDACRHFVWAALLYKTFRIDFSQKILDAHEQDNKQPVEEKAMDLANNRLGLITAEELLRKNKLNESTVLKSFQKNLKSGNLVVLKEINKKTIKGKK